MNASHTKEVTIPFARQQSYEKGFTGANREAFTPQDDSTSTSVHMKRLHWHTSLVYQFDLDNCGTSDWNVSGLLITRLKLDGNLGFFRMT
jgi:hypothetical protein